MIVRTVRTVSELHHVWQLTAKSYSRVGYVTDVEELAHHKEFDLLDETTLYGSTNVWYILGASNKVIGTVSITIDTARGLPDDDKFLKEINTIREECQYYNLTLANCWRIATNTSYKCVIGSLFDQCHYWCTEIEKVDVLVATFNPHHVKLYQRMFGFKPISSVNSQAELQNAPAVLMRWDRKDADIWLASRHKFCCSQLEK